MDEQNLIHRDVKPSNIMMRRMKTLDGCVWAGLFTCSLVAPTARAGPSEIAPASPALSFPESIVSSEEVEKLRATVLKHIERLAFIGKAEKDKLRNTLVNSKNLALLSTVPFENAITKITPEASAKIASQIEQAKFQERLSDSNVMVLVLGFADQLGQDDGNRNYFLSMERAESVAAVLRERCGLRNLICAIPMGIGISLFDSEEYTKKRVVEVWSAEH
jgi:outer membrane protein OmpA-like peptidoglycan-associated protein